MVVRLFILLISILIMASHSQAAFVTIHDYTYQKCMNVNTNGNTICTASATPLQCCTGSGTGTCLTTTTSLSYFPVAVHINSSSFSNATERGNFFDDTYNPLGKRVQFFAEPDSDDATMRGTHTGSNNAATLTDSGKSWTSSALIGMRVKNTTDGSSCTITANAATTITCTLSGGSENDWDTGDAYALDFNYEVEYYSNANEEAVYWVAIPTVASGSSNTALICVGYGNDPNSADQDNKTKVWDSNYKAVFHLGSNGWVAGDSSSEAKDSTANAYHGDSSGVTANQTAYIFNGTSWDGTSDYIGMNTNLRGLTTTTISLWLLTDTTSGEDEIWYDWAASDCNIIFNRDAAKLKFYNGNGSTGADTAISSATNLSTATWYYAAAWRNGTDHRIYLNGAQDVQATQSYSGGATAASLKFGAYTDGTYSWDGLLDELRVSSTARAADWMNAEYFSMKKTNFNGDSWITWETAEETEDIPPSEYEITVTDTSHCDVSPNTLNVTAGNSQVFTITPDAGYYISTVTVDSASQGPMVSYTFSNVGATHTITASCSAFSAPTYWLSGFPYRKLIPISGVNDIGTNYQILLHVYAGTGTDSASAIYLNNHTANFPHDLRFTQSDGRTLLYHYVDPNLGTSTDKYIWVKVAEDLGSAKRIGLYYGDATASSTSSGDNTFDFIDEFDTVWTRVDECTGLNNQYWHGQPSVLFEGNPQILTEEEEVFKMWHSRYDATGDVDSYLDYLESTDGIAWTPHDDNPLITDHIGQSFVFKFGSTYYAFGCNWEDGYENRTSLYRYHSSDGVTWTGDGVVFSRATDFGNVYVWVEGTSDWKMIYDYYYAGYWRMGYATSSNGTSWTDQGELTGNSLYLGGPFMRYGTQKIGTTYYLWGHRGNVPSDFYKMSSTNLTSWTTYSQSCTFCRFTSDENPASSAAQFADYTFLDFDDGTYMWYTYYSAQTSMAQHTLLATSTLSFDALATSAEDSINATKWNVPTGPTIIRKGDGQAQTLSESTNTQVFITNSYQITNGLIELKLKPSPSSFIWFRRSSKTQGSNAYTTGQGLVTSSTGGSEHAIFVDNVNKANATSSATTDTYYWYRLIANGVNLTAKRYTNNLFTTGEVSTTYADTGGLTTGYIGFGDYSAGTGINTIVDWIRVRKYSATEPTLYAVESEEYSPQGSYIPYEVIYH